MNSLLIILACLAISSTFTADASFSQFEQDFNNFKDLNFGIDKLLEQGRQATEIVNNFFKVSRKDNVSYEQSEGIDHYDFVIKFDDSEESAIQANLHVQLIGDQATGVISLSYEVVYTLTRTTEIETNSDIQEAVPVVNNSGTQDIPPVEIHSDIVLTPKSREGHDEEEALNFGVYSALHMGLKDPNIPSEEDYNITEINFSNQTFEDNVYYDFGVKVANGQGNAAIDMTVSVVKNSDGEMKVTAFSVSGKKTTITIKTAWTDVNVADDIGPDSFIPSSQYNDPEIREALTFGRDYVLQTGSDNVEIQNGEDYYMTNINSILQETRGNIVRYKFDLTMENTAGNNIIQMKYTVGKKRSGERKVVAFDYSIQTTIEQTR